MITCHLLTFTNLYRGMKLTAAIKALFVCYGMLYSFKHTLANDDNEADPEINLNDFEDTNASFYYDVITPKWSSSPKTIQACTTSTIESTTKLPETELIKTKKSETTSFTPELSTIITTTTAIETTTPESATIENKKFVYNYAGLPLGLDSGRKDVTELIDLLTSPDRRLYTDYYVISISPGSLEQLLEILKFETDTDYSFWSHRRVLDVPIVVLIPPKQTALIKHLRDHRIDYKIMMEDVQRSFDYEMESMFNTNMQPSVIGISFHRYLKYDFIMKYLHYLSDQYPEITRLITIGQTAENRNITVIEVKDSRLGEPPQGAILLEAGMHGREWLSVSAALYAINQLVEHAAANQDMLRGISWYILPVLNADGYDYSHNFDRLWKRNRRKDENQMNSCTGIDLDRNFDVGAGEWSRAKFACTDLYGGAQAGSEVETKALKRFIKSLGIVKAYVSLHSGDTFIAYPWAYKTERIIQYENCVELAQRIKTVIEAADNSSQYVTGSLSTVCGIYDGSAVDWAHQAGVAYPLMISLKGATENGFDIPQENIYDAVLAAFEGIRAIANYLHIPKNDTIVIQRRGTLNYNNSSTVSLLLTSTFVWFFISFLI